MYVLFVTRVSSTAAPKPPPGYTEANYATQLPQSDLDAREMSPGVRHIHLLNTQLGAVGALLCPSGYGSSPMLVLGLRRI